MYIFPIINDIIIKQMYINFRISESIIQLAKKQMYINFIPNNTIIRKLHVNLTINEIQHKKTTNTVA